MFVKSLIYFLLFFADRLAVLMLLILSDKVRQDGKPYRPNPLVIHKALIGLSYSIIILLSSSLSRDIFNILFYLFIDVSCLLTRTYVARGCPRRPNPLRGKDLGQQHNNIRTSGQGCTCRARDARCTALALGGRFGSCDPCDHTPGSQRADGAVGWRC